jgi:hypothetical protein
MKDENGERMAARGRRPVCARANRRHRSYLRTNSVISVELLHPNQNSKVPCPSRMQDHLACLAP